MCTREWARRDVHAGMGTWGCARGDVHAGMGTREWARGDVPADTIAVKISGTGLYYAFASWTGIDKNTFFQDKSTTTVAIFLHLFPHFPGPV